MARELDDAILMFRSNELELGLWLLRTGRWNFRRLKMDDDLANSREDWLVRETVGLLRRTFARLDVSSRSMFAIIDPNSCFAGMLLELALAADRTYMLSLPDAQENSKFRAAIDFRHEFRSVANRERPQPFRNSFSRRRRKLAKLQATRRFRWAQRKPSHSAWSRSPPTIWIGKTNCASPSKSAPAFRPMRSPAWKRVCVFLARKPSKPKFLADFPRGKTGFLSGPMLPERTAR